MFLIVFFFNFLIFAKITKKYLKIKQKHNNFNYRFYDYKKYVFDQNLCPVASY